MYVIPGVSKEMTSSTGANWGVPRMRIDVLTTILASVESGPRRLQCGWEEVNS